MIRQGSLVVAILAAFTINGCATTSVSSFRAPNFDGATFDKIGVFANTSNLEWRSSLEDSMVHELRELGGNAVATNSIISPTETLGADEVLQRLSNENVDALLVVTVGDSGVSEVWVPQRSTSAYSGAGSMAGGTGTYAGSGSSVTTGGYTAAKPWAQMSTGLFDMATGQTVWVASSSTHGTEYSSFKTVRQSYSRKVAAELATEKFW